MPIPGSPAENVALSFIQSWPWPVRMTTTSPSRIATPCVLSAISRSRAVMTSPLFMRSHATRGRHVDQDAAREEHADVFDAELLEPVGGAELRSPEAVVKVVVAIEPDADVSQAVELGADLADLAAEQVSRDTRSGSCRSGRRSATRGSSG